MRQVTVLQGQTITDIALQEYGSAEGLFAFLEANQNLDLDSQLEPGQKVLVKEEDVVNSDIVNYFQGNNITVVSSL